MDDINYADDDCSNLHGQGILIPTTDIDPAAWGLPDTLYNRLEFC
jgi:hypothetical protein